MVVGFGKVGAQQHGAVQAGERLCKALEADQRDAAVVMRLRVPWLQLQRPVMGLQRLVVALEPFQHHAAVVMGLGILWLQRHRPIIGGQRFRQAVELAQGIATVVVHGRMVGQLLQRLVQQR